MFYFTWNNFQKTTIFRIPEFLVSRHDFYYFSKCAVLKTRNKNIFIDLQISVFIFAFINKQYFKNCIIAKHQIVIIPISKKLNNNG